MARLPHEEAQGQEIFAARRDHAGPMERRVYDGAIGTVMDSRSDDRDVSRTSETADGSGPQSDAEAVDSHEPDNPTPSPPDYSDEPCFTEAELKAILPPIPDYMRRGPRPKSPQRELFDRK